MNNQFDKIEGNILPDTKKVAKKKISQFTQNLPGKITDIVGSGDNARNTFVYLTLKWSFIAGLIITGLVVLNHWCFRLNDKIPDFMGDIKITWGIVVPIITLALGYAFGKSEK